MDVWLKLVAALRSGDWLCVAKCCMQLGITVLDSFHPDCPPVPMFAGTESTPLCAQSATELADSIQSQLPVEAGSSGETVALSKDILVLLAPILLEAMKRAVDWLRTR